MVNYHQKRIRVDDHYFVVTENSQFPSMVLTMSPNYSKSQYIIGQEKYIQCQHQIRTFSVQSAKASEETGLGFIGVVKQ